MNLYLIRGLPGSGKSTFAEMLAENLGACHHEADHYFHYYEGPSGTVVWREEYTFDATKLHAAHCACKGWTEDCMLDECDIVVSNTFTTEKELKPYLELAAKHGYKVTTLVVENRHGNSSIHGVPEDTMAKMKNRFSVKL
jgi:predicted kinase